MKKLKVRAIKKCKFCDKKDVFASFNNIHFCQSCFKKYERKCIKKGFIDKCGKYVAIAGWLAFLEATIIILISKYM